MITKNEFGEGMCDAKVFFVGDPHGESEFIVDLALSNPTSKVVLLGDLQFSEKDCSLLPKNVFWIHGNHDTDKDEYTHVINHQQNISSTVQNFGVAVGGLGGIFRQKSWDVRCEKYPHFSRLEKEESLPKHHTMPRKELSSIYPSDVQELLSFGTCDILVAHEAPRISRLLGSFGKIDDVARKLRANTIIHGHHHVSYVREVNYLKVFGVGLREILEYCPKKKTFTFIQGVV